MKIEEEIKSSFANENQKAVINVIYTASWLGQIQASFFKTFDITPPQYNVLRIVNGQAPKPVSVATIINRMIDKASNASRIIDRLEKKELVNRTTCAKDRRQVDVTLTQKGEFLLQAIAPEINHLEANMSSLSQQELEQLNSLLDKLRTKKTEQ